MTDTRPNAIQEMADEAKRLVQHAVGEANEGNDGRPDSYRSKLEAAINTLATEAIRLNEGWQQANERAVAPAAPLDDETEALDLLTVIFDAYEDGDSCYDDPEDGSFIGNAVRLDEETETKIANLLDRRRPRLTAPVAMPLPAHVGEESHGPSQSPVKLYDGQQIRERDAQWQAQADALTRERDEAAKAHGALYKEVSGLHEWVRSLNTEIAALRSAPTGAQPLTSAQANAVWREWTASGTVGVDWLSLLRAVERAHGIVSTPAAAARPVDSSRCKFAAGGANCVTWCGDNECRLGADSGVKPEYNPVWVDRYPGVPTMYYGADSTGDDCSISISEYLESVERGAQIGKPSAEACRRCGAQMAPGTALESTYAGIGDFSDADAPVTVSPGGPGRLVACRKCVACGWSVGVAEIVCAEPWLKSSEVRERLKDGN